MFSTILTMLLKVMGGLGIFLLGMKHLSEGLQAVSGKRLRRMVAVATTNRLAGVATGIVSTVIVQSSSVITVMLVGLVNTQLMTLAQAINVIIGSHIGTTATAWLLSVIPSIGMLGLGMIAIASIFYFFNSKERLRNIGLGCLGFGLIFFGLQLMEEAMDPIASSTEVKNWFGTLDANSFWGLIKCILASAGLTALIQSSAATTAIVMALAGKGIITFETACAAVLGMNIGTTITAWLAAMNSTTDGKRAALAHTLINSIGVLIFIPLFFPAVMPIMRSIFPNILQSAVDAKGAVTYPQIPVAMACLHTLFNVVNTCLFLPFVVPFAALVAKLVPYKSKTHEVPRLTILDTRIIHTPEVAVEQAFHEVLFMADSDLELLTTFRRLLSGEEDSQLEEHILHREGILDVVQREITDFLGHFLTVRLPAHVAFRARALLRITDELESVSDEVAALLKMLRRLRVNNLSFTENGRKELLQVHDQLTQFGTGITEALKADLIGNPNQIPHMRADSENIKVLTREVRARHLSRLENNSANPAEIVVCMDIINAYIRMKEEYVNIAEVLIGGK
ncbi:MAG: Na/Pi cotransporter family protein [Kiritimatiellae bacterium]|nr:Na/Pi cotransporter family protein [Kiritimatiellia bacterium]